MAQRQKQKVMSTSSQFLTSNKVINVASGQPNQSKELEEITREKILKKSYKTQNLGAKFIKSGTFWSFLLNFLIFVSINSLVDKIRAQGPQQGGNSPPIQLPVNFMNNDVGLSQFPKTFDFVPPELYHVCDNPQEQKKIDARALTQHMYEIQCTNLPFYVPATQKNNIEVWYPLFYRDLNNQQVTSYSGINFENALEPWVARNEPGFIDLENDPKALNCLISYNEIVCGRCLWGMIRIFTPFYVKCGYQRPDTNPVPDYSSTLNWQQNIEFTDTVFLHEQDKWELQQKFIFYEPTNMFLQFYVNQTSGMNETIALDADLIGEYYNETACKIQADQEWATKLTGLELTLAQMTIGCRQCKENHYPRVIYRQMGGINTLTCDEIKPTTPKKVDQKCAAGSIYSMQGFIKQEYKLTCVTCDKIIPDCVICESGKECTLCKTKFRQSKLKDALGVINSVCLYEFCGFTGLGTNCSPDMTIKNCLKSETIKAGQVVQESCVRCDQDYYIYPATTSYFEFDTEVGDFVELSLTYNTCAPKSGLKQVDLFVESLDTGELTPQQKMRFLQAKGQSLDDPFLSITQAINAINYETYAPYQEVVVNVWLFKGIHHFIDCFQPSQVDIPDLMNPVDQNIALLCADLTNSNYQNQFEYVSAVMKQKVELDNVKFYFRAMRCDYTSSFFINMAKYGLQADFHRNCIDLEKEEEKPQIRLSSPYTNFNITNFAQFEDIQFTGEDLFAEGELNGIPTPFYQFVPMKKCNVTKEPYDTISELRMQTQGWVNDNGIGLSYTCDSYFDAHLAYPPYEKNKRCFDDEYQPEATSFTCTGEPYHATFFSDFDSTSGVYSKRHRVLFNLYSFDKLHSSNKYPPELRLINCDFKYFAHYDALIQVENKNFALMGLVTTTTQESNQPGAPPPTTTISTENAFLGYIGEDRGARITIQGSSVKHSKFCKGMVYYDRLAPITFEDEPLLVNFTANFEQVPYYYKEDYEPYILLTGNLFENIGYMNIAQGLMMKKADKVTNDAFQGSKIKIEFPRFMDQGQILNLRGFAGKVQISDNEVTKSIAYIQEVLIFQQPVTQQFFEIDDQEISRLFGGQYQNFYTFRWCASDYSSRYLFAEIGNPHGEYDDQAQINVLESIAPFFLKGISRTILFQDNTMYENIGTTGGVIHIEDQEMRFVNQTGLPAIVIRRNTFKNNMAYFGGNVFHISLTQRMIVPNWDAQHVCGAGILIEDNYFKNNIGLKRHNGGVGVIRCSKDAEFDQMYYSGLKRNMTVQELSLWNLKANKNWRAEFLDPVTHLTQVGSVVDANGIIKVLTYGTLVRKNTFERNFSGMKGSALLIDGVNELQIVENNFFNNGPVTAYMEIAHSPFYKYFTYGNRTLSFHLIDTHIFGECMDETQYMRECRRENYQIDMPLMQGAVYVANCNDPQYCYHLSSDLNQHQIMQANVTETKENADRYLQMNTIYQHLKIDNNLFYDNKANVVLQNAQIGKQAASLFIQDGTNNHITRNQFKDHYGFFNEYMMSFSWDLHRYMPKDYFKYSQAPVIQVEYSYSFQATAWSFNLGKNLSTVFQLNRFENNHNFQVISFSSRAYQYFGSLVQFQCDLPQTVLTFKENIVERNKFIGPNGALFFVFGGQTVINNNYFGYNGRLSKLLNQAKPTDFYREYTTTEFPYEAYAIQASQQHGMFHFSFDQDNMLTAQHHNVFNNTFEHIYCNEGCAYYVSGNKMQQFSFQGNLYQYLVADSGAVMKHLTLGDVSSFQRVHLNFFANEKIRYTFGGAIVLWAANVPITIIEDSEFDMNFGNEGSSVSSYYGGALFMNNCTFTMSEASEESQETIFAQKTGFLFKSYDNQLPIDRLIEQTYLEELSKVDNYLGQVMMSYSLSNIEVANDIIPLRNNQTISQHIQDTYGILITQTDSSQIQDSFFFNNIGQLASSLFLDNSVLNLKATGSLKSENFQKNIARAGSTIGLENSLMNSQNMFFLQNKGQKGGCFFLDASSVFVDQNSVYERNESALGGVFYVINNCQVLVQGSQFFQNVATSTAIIYSMYNNGPNALMFTNCIFQQNKAKTSYMMQLLNSKMLVTNCEFVDNWAQDTNHGLTMIRSDVEIVSTEIHWTDSFGKENQFLQVQTGFFRLLLGSNLYIRENSSIHDLKATNQAILSADSMSSLFVSGGVKIERNVATSGEGGSTFELLNTMDAIFDQVYFADNRQIAIKMDVGSLQINDSTFTRNEDVTIDVKASSVSLKQVLMQDSPHLKPTFKAGTGLYCAECTKLEIENSQFLNLTADMGGSIFLKDFQSFNAENDNDEISYVKNSTFKGNKAKNGGAIYLKNTRKLSIERNKFLQNSAIEGGVQGGGAILHSCPKFAQGLANQCDVSLQSNLFANNSASVQGGALRYLNKNFTFIHENDLSFGSDDSSSTSLRRNLKSGNDTNIFENNTAIYGEDLASFPRQIVSRMVSRASGVELFDDQRLLQFASGQELQLEVSILDQEGRVYSAENAAVCNFQFLTNQTLGSKASILGNQVVAVDGVFNFTRLQISIEPDTAAQIRFEITQLDDYENLISFMDEQNPHIFNIFARSCVEGEQYTGDLKCIPCPKRFFLYVKQTAPGTCQTCPNEAVCYGMNITAPRYGYWRSNATSNDFYPCMREESCIGGNLTEPFGICEEGYNGIMCTNCDKAWARSGSFGCRQCPDFFWNLLSFFMLTIVLILVVYGLVRSTLGGVQAKKPLYSVYFRIFMNHFQILSSVANIDFKWPDSIKQLIATQQSVAEAPASVLNVDCLLMDIALGDEPPVRMNYLRLVSLTLLPFAIFAISFLFWNVYAACNHVQQRSDKITATTIIVLFLFYPTIVAALAQSVNCISIDGEQRLFKDLEEVCFQGTHLWVVIFVSIPGLLAWAVGIPIYALIKLRANIAFLEKIKQKSQGKQHEDLMKSFKVRLGFLTAGYDDNFYYWEIVLLMRKSAIVLMIVFLSPVSSGIQSLTSILVLTIFYNVQLALEPYYDPTLNQMESLSLLVIVLTIFGGLFYQAGQDEVIMTLQSVEVVIFLLVLIPSVIFTINFLLKMRIEILKIAINKSPKAFRFVTCGVTDMNEFRMKYLGQMVEQESLESEENEQKIKSLHKSFSIRKNAEKGQVIDPSQVKFVPKHKLQETKAKIFNEKSNFFSEKSFLSHKPLVRIDSLPVKNLKLTAKEPQSMISADGFESGLQSGEISDIYYSKSQIGRQPQSRSNSQNRLDSARKLGKFIANNYEYANELDFGNKSQNNAGQQTQMISGDDLSVFNDSDSSSDYTYTMGARKNSRFKTVGVKRNQSVASMLSAEEIGEISARGREIINQGDAAEVKFKAIPIGKLFIKKDMKRLEGRNQRENGTKSVQVSARRQNMPLQIGDGSIQSKKRILQLSNKQFTPIKVTNKIAQSIYNDQSSNDDQIFISNQGTIQMPQRSENNDEHLNQPNVMVGNFFKKLSKKIKVKDNDVDFGKASAKIVKNIQSDLDSSEKSEANPQSLVGIDRREYLNTGEERLQISTGAEGAFRRSSGDENNTYGLENAIGTRISSHVDETQQRDYKNLKKLIGRRIR